MNDVETRMELSAVVIRQRDLEAFGEIIVIVERFCPECVPSELKHPLDNINTGAGKSVPGSRC